MAVPSSNSTSGCELLASGATMVIFNQGNSDMNPLAGREKIIVSGWGSKALADPHRFDDQVALGLACLFTLQGLPCIYYGTEQGLHGGGDRPENVREALWGKPGGFDRAHPCYQLVRTLSELRANNPTLRYGRFYMRPISGNGIDFGLSQYERGVLAYSRLLSDEEILVVANTSTEQAWSGEVIVDFELNKPGSHFVCAYSNRLYSQGMRHGPVKEKTAEQVFVVAASGNPVRGALRTIALSLEPMEIRILKNEA